jgi:SEC-C motif-containing protein
MRSRFTAFAEGRAQYLLHSWAPEARPAEVRLPPDRRWVSLTILDTVDGGALAKTGIVEFVAHYEDPAGGGTLHERSTFRRHDGRWVYVAGTVG